MADDVFDYWFPWYPARFKRKTMHLTVIQRAIYRELIDFYMETRAALPDSDIALARIVGISVEEFAPNSDVIKAFFKVKKQGKNNVLFHPTCEGVLRDQKDRAETRKNRAKKGGKGKAEKHNKNNGQPASSRPQAVLDGEKTPLNPATGQDSIEQNKTGKRDTSNQTIVSNTTNLRARGEAPRQQSMTPEVREADAEFERYWASLPREKKTNKALAHSEWVGGGFKNSGGKAVSPLRKKLMEQYPPQYRHGVQPTESTKPVIDFDITRHLTARDGEEMSQHMPGWSEAAIIQRYNGWIRDKGQAPSAPGPAFRGWLKKQPKTP